MNNDLLNNLNKIKELTPLFKIAMGEDEQWGSLYRLPVSIYKCEKGCLISGSRNGSITYSSAERTYLSTDVVNALYCTQSFLDAIPQGINNKTGDETFDFILSLCGAQDYSLKIKEFVFSNVEFSEEKGNDNYPFYSTELNSMKSECNDNWIEFQKNLNIFYAFTLLIDEKRPYLQKIINNELDWTEVSTSILRTNKIIFAMKDFINSYNVNSARDCVKIPF